jgi:phosphoglycerate dehydrogenase-like enzyme
MLLALAKDLKRVERAVVEQRHGDYFSAHRGVEIAGQRLGLVGLGRIGREVARLAQGLGLIVSAFDPHVGPATAIQVGVDLRPTIQSLLADADFISLHLPYTPETHHLFNADRLRQMKPGAFLINCARGGLVDEQALLEALQQGHLRGAALDVLEREPPAADHPLLSREDAIVTPHVAAATDAARDRLWRGALQQALDVLSGKRPANLVNAEVWPLPLGPGIASDDLTKRSVR